MRLMCPPRRPVGVFHRKRFNPWLDLEWWEHPEAIEVIQANPEGMTLEQIGATMSITRERVRQIEAGALEKLRNNTGAEVIDVGRFSVAIPDCEICALPFLRKNGRDRRCEGCMPTRHRKTRRHVVALATG